MPREKLGAKFVGPRDADGVPLEFLSGIVARDLSASEFEALSDGHKALMAASPLYDLRNEALAEAVKAEKRVERAEAMAAPVAPTEVSHSAPEAPKG